MQSLSHTPVTGDLIELQIERMSFGPAAVGRYDLGGPKPVVVFVRGAAPQEKIRARLTKTHKNFWEAELVEILQPSPDRIQPPCPVYEKCGGCQWQHLSYQAQITAKKEVLLHQLARTLKISTTDLEPLTTVHPAAQEFGYRARVQVRGNQEGLGFFEEGSHRIAATDRCLVCHPRLQEEWTRFLAQKKHLLLSQKTSQFKIEWTLTAHGQIRESINREHSALGFTQINPQQNEVMVNLVTKLAGSSTGHLLLDLYGGSGNLSQRLASHFKHIICVDAFGPGSPAQDIKTPLAPGHTYVRERIEDFLVAQRWREWGCEQISTIIADPPRAGLVQTATAIASLHVPTVVLVSCDPATIARDLSQFTKNYKIRSIHLIDMFPQTYHIEIVVLLQHS